jgi:ATP-dependent RNA helicase RhlE
MTFQDLNLNPALFNALNDLGFETPTPIQGRSFPVAMSGTDLVGLAQTGTGKTLAYLLPCLRKWSFTKEKHPTILVIVPTRELVAQIVEEAEKLTAYMNVRILGVFGGANINIQAQNVINGVDLLVATPGRLLDLALSGALKLKAVKRVVIDEVDELLSLGFRPQLVRVLDMLPPKRQNLMFSATMDEEVEQFIQTFFNTPQFVEAAPSGTPLAGIEQRGYTVPNFNSKINFLKLLLSDTAAMQKVLVFIGSKKLADDVAQALEPLFAEQVGVIHGNKSQNFRFQAVENFKTGLHRILIATDVVARGLDVAEVSHVINFDMPEIAQDYLHRIGRTGRADKRGIAITFIHPDDAERQTEIETLMQQAIPMLPLPEDLVLSDVLTEDEKPKIFMKTIEVKIPKREDVGPAFHEKSLKNQKYNQKLTRKQQMALKYKKPKTRGSKKK